MDVILNLCYLETESDIINGCLNGDNAAHKFLYDRYKRKLMGISSRYCSSREQAQDVMQESFIIIFTSIHKFTGKGSFEGWISRIVINTAIKMNRKWEFRRSSAEIETMDMPDIALDPLQKIQHEELLLLVQKLPTGYRTVFNMYVIDGFSHEEISDELGISVGTSRSQLSRARETLAKWIRTIEKKRIFNYEQHRG
jgi:RNA polymerase sigma-70 factor (ECF subfamily)